MEIGTQNSIQEQSCRVKRDKLGLLAKGSYFECAGSIRFEKVYLIFMSVCFKSFDVSYNLSRTATPVRNHVVCKSQTNWFLNKLSE